MQNGANIVDIEKCCQTHIYLQKSEPIQPKTSNILPKICRSAVVSPTGATELRAARVGPRSLRADSASGSALPPDAQEDGEQGEAGEVVSWALNEDSK